MSLTGKLIYVPVSDELHEKIERAAKANGDTFEEWVRQACEESIAYDTQRHRERAQRRRPGRNYTSGGPWVPKPQWVKAVKP